MANGTAVGKAVKGSGSLLSRPGAREGAPTTREEVGVGGGSASTARIRSRGRWWGMALTGGPERSAVERREEATGGFQPLVWAGPGRRREGGGEQAGGELREC
jgi:hypothetical protein